MPIRLGRVGASQLVAAVVLATTSCTAGDDRPSRLDPTEAPTTPAPTALDAAPDTRPEPLLPDLTTLRASGVRIEGSGTGRLLRFGTTLANPGVGPLEAVPDKRSRCPRGERSFRQRLRLDSNRDGVYDPRADTRTTSRGGVCVLFHPTHLHWHIDGSARYSVFDSLGRRVATTRKVSFCLRDSARLPGGHGRPGEWYTDCERDLRQGISPGWGDLYDFDLDGQTLPLPRGLTGAVCLRMTADPFDYFRETDESNNSSHTALRVRGARVSVGGPGCRNL